ncbi:MAG: regulator of sigma E protease [Verrucomicrobiales bacterium]|jgi:regulator of sigma E protease
MHAILQILQVIGILLLVFGVFSLLIIVHEWGHFLAAKWRGLKIDRFQVWFGKPIWKFTRGGVQYGLGWIPFGGFVSIPQMAPMEAIEGKTNAKANSRDLPPVSSRDKIIVAFAGPLFSFLLAVFCALIVWVVGKPAPDQATATEVGHVMPGSVAAEAGILAGDKILWANGEKVRRIHGMIDSLDWHVVASETPEVQIRFERDGTVMTRTLALSQDDIDTSGSTKSDKSWWKKTLSFIFHRPPLPDTGILGRERPCVGEVMPHSPAAEAGMEIGDLVVAMNGEPVLNRLQIGDFLYNENPESVQLTFLRGDQTRTVTLRPRLPEKRPAEVERPMVGLVWDEFGKGRLEYINPGVQIAESVTMMQNTLGAIFNPASEVGPTHLNSAVGIMRLYYRLFEHQDGWRLVLWFSVVLNINLAILNLLPIPLLDGGHIVMASLEGIFQRPLPIKSLKIIQTGTAVLLLGFMAVLALKDIGDIAAETQFGAVIEFLPPNPSTSSG